MPPGSAFYRIRLGGRRATVAPSAILLAVCLSAAANAGPHPRQYVTTVWQTDQGLPQNSVHNIAQDQEGYLWLATWGGLVRFDGIRFRVFGSADIPGLNSSRILSLCASRSGVLWIGTRDGSVTQLHGGSATTYTESDGLPGKIVSSIQEDLKGDIWINTSGGVARFTGAKLEVVRAYRGRAVSQFFLQARDGSMWFRSGDETVRFGADGSITSLKGGFLVRESKNGNVWVGFQGQNRLVRHHRGGFSEVPLPPITRRQWTGQYDDRGVLAMATDTDGEILLLTASGLVRTVGETIGPPETVPLSADMAGAPKALSLLVDREGNRWVGTLLSGLFRFRPAPLTAYGKAEGLSDSSIEAVFQDREGRVWVGGESLYRFDGRRFQRVPGLADVRAIAQSRDGDLWFGGSGGLYRWRSGVLSRYRIDAPAVRAIHQDEQGTLWIVATSYERPGGLYRFRDGKFEQVAADVDRIAESRHGGLWLTSRRGLTYLQGGKQVLHEWNLLPVPDLREDSSGALWIANYGAGLIRFRDGEFRAITPKDGLPNESPVAILEDREGHLWVSSDRNIFRFSLKELNDLADGRTSSISPVSYGVAEGMKSSECNSGSPGVWKTTDGRIWFPTLRGVVAIDPNAGYRAPPNVLVEEAWANKVMLARDRKSSVPPGNNTFDFHFTALSLSAPEKVRFKYRLDPYDKDWVDAGNRQTAHYTNMAPGEYSFHVIAANGYGVWNERGASVRFVLEPHFHETRWFSALLVAGIVLCAAGAYRLRIRQLRARELHLAQLVDSRTEELREEIKVREAAEAGLRQARDELEDRVRERTAQLAESEQRFRTFADHAADALFVLDYEQATVFDVNQEACQSLGCARDELLGRSIAEFDVNVDRTAFDSIAKRAAEGESVVDIHWHRRKNGDVFPVEVHTSLVWYGGRRYLLKIARDITDRLRVEEERERLRQREAELAHINRVSMMGELSTSIAHEVNQPLSGVVSNGSACLRWLAGDPPNLEEAREAVRRIVRDGKRAGDVIARIRSLTKRAAAPQEQLDLNETVREVLDLVADKARKEAVRIRTRFEHGLAPVSGDRVQLQQVILNLVMNAIEAMSGVRDGTRDLLLTTRNIGADRVQVSVEDSGPGIGPDRIGKIFDPFYTTKADGMGMGLSISRSIVQNHGGRLWTESNVGQGTVFHFILPKAGEPESDAAPTEV